MIYLVRSYGHSNIDYNHEDFIFLEIDNWDDYHYKTTFHMKIFKNNKEIEVGSLKILHINEKRTSNIIEDKFDKLTEDFVSIGGDSNYYENLISIYGKSKAFEILKDLKDMSISKLKESKFEIKHLGIQNSLFRSSNGRYLYEEVLNSYFSTKQSATEKDYCFVFKTKYEEQYMTDINIDFKKHNQLPNRLFALIGKNGVGKTRFLNQLSESLFDSSSEKNKGRFIIDGKEEIPAYQKIIAISFSAFDNFFKGKKEENKGDKTNEIKETKLSNYTYIGISSIDNNVYTSEEILKIDKKNYSVLCEKGREQEFIDLINDSNILNKRIPSKNDFKEYLFSQNYSSGQKIFISMLCRLLAEISSGSLIFLDEPELYLHPNAISSLMKIFSSTLENYQSYAILCTHSPILIQEIPSRYVRNLLLIDGDVAQTEVSIETFGANISDINREIFNVTDRESLYKTTLRKLSENLAREEVENLFDNDLSLKANMYLSKLYLEKE